MSGGTYINAKPIPASNTSIQNANWSGSISILLSLAPTSLSSPTTPRPIHKMISRVTYLHVALHEEVMKLSGYAPVAGAGLSSALSGMSVEEPPDSPTEGGDKVEDSGEKSEGPIDDSTEKESSKSPQQTEPDQSIKQPAAYPECWFEDEDSGTPLRWHLFVGILYDLMKGKAMLNGSSSWKGRAPNESSQHNFLPWRIRVHFTSYPTDRLLPLDDGTPQPKLDKTNNNDGGDEIHSRITTLVGRMFRNSLKQALFLQYGSSKVAMSINKSSHENIWEAVLQSNYEMYHEVNQELQSGLSSPPISSQSTIDSMVVKKDDQSDVPQLIPVRLMLNGMPAIQKRTKHKKDSKDVERKRPTEILEQLGTCQAPPYTTLGDFLAHCLPSHFAVDPSTGWTAAISDSPINYYIQGIQPCLKCPMVDIWRSLSHPDHFLYVTVVTE